MYHKTILHDFTSDDRWTSGCFQNDFLLDTIILEYLKDLTFVHDANMYIVYASKFGMDTTAYIESELNQLAVMHRSEIDKFIVDSAVQLIYDILNKWSKRIVDPNCDVYLSVPEHTYPNFKKFIAFSKTATIEYDDDMVDGISESIRHAFVEDSWTDLHKRNIYVPINPDDAFSVLSYMMKLSDDIRMFSRKDDYIKKHFHTAISNLINFTTLFLRMTCITVYREVNTHGYDTPFDNPQLLFDKFILKRNIQLLRKTDGEIVRRMRTLEISHVACMDWTHIPENLILLKQPITTVTDSSRFVVCRILQQRLAASDKRMEEGAIKEH